MYTKSRTAATLRAAGDDDSRVGVAHLRDGGKVGERVPTRSALLDIIQVLPVFNLWKLL